MCIFSHFSEFRIFRIQNLHARMHEQAEVISEMGGKNPKHVFKEFERARIKQETMVGKQQSLFYMLAKESEVLLSMRSWCLFSGFCFANFCSADVVCESDIPLCISASRIFPWK